MNRQRDIVKNEMYFKSFIESKAKSIASLRNTASGTESEMHLRHLLYSIFHDELELWIARYSAGEDMGILKNKFIDVINALDEYQRQPDSEKIRLSVLADYIQSLWLTAIAYLLDVDDYLFNRIIALINQNGKDGLFDQLVKLRRPEHPAVNELLHPKPYLALYNALFAQGDEQQQMIIQFIETYYSNIKDVYFMDIDREKGDYFGRWLFELAAFVKGKHIDDRLFVNNMHYPKDLV